MGTVGRKEEDERTGQRTSHNIQPAGITASAAQQAQSPEQDWPCKRGEYYGRDQRMIVGRQKQIANCHGRYRHARREQQRRKERTRSQRDRSHWRDVPVRLPGPADDREGHEEQPGDREEGHRGPL